MLLENKGWATGQLFAWLKLSDVKGPVFHLSCECLLEDQQDLNNFSYTTDLRFKIIFLYGRGLQREKSERA